MLSPLEEQANAYARRLGRLIRVHREAAGLRLEDLAAAVGVGIRFIQELEHGKASCQLGRALVVASALGLEPIDLLEQDQSDDILASVRER